MATRQRGRRPFSLSSYSVTVPDMLPKVCRRLVGARILCSSCPTAKKSLVDEYETGVSHSV